MKKLHLSNPQLQPTKENLTLIQGKKNTKYSGFFEWKNNVIKPVLKGIQFLLWVRPFFRKELDFFSLIFFILCKKNVDEKNKKFSSCLMWTKYEANYLNLEHNIWVVSRAGESEPVGAGCFWLLGAGAAKKNRSRSHLEKKSGSGAGPLKD